MGRVGVVKRTALRKILVVEERFFLFFLLIFLHGFVVEIVVYGSRSVIKSSSSVIGLVVGGVDDHGQVRDFWFG